MHFAVARWQLTDQQARRLFLQSDTRVDGNGRTVYQNVQQLTGDVLDQYFPGGLGKHDKLFSLLVLVGGFMAGAVQAIAAMPAGPAEVTTFPRSATATQQD